MDGIMAISQRMAALADRVSSVAPATRTSVQVSASSAAFSSVLADLVERTTASGTVTASAAAGSATNNVPDELAAYGNGQVPASALDEVGTTGHRLWGPAASAMETMVAAARRDGVTIGITDSYRSYAAQVDVAERKGLYSQGGLAATPGTSEHGWGMAVDLDLDSSAQTWMRANAAEFGFEENTPREPWHWVYRA